MSFTVVPVHNLDLPVGTQISFGNGFVFQDVPEWLRNDDCLLKRLSSHDRESALDAKHAWVAEYEASAIGEPDPDWKGEPKSIQKSKFESAILANLALWLSQPSNVCFTIGFHAISHAIPGETVKVPILQQTEHHTRLHCHPNDANNSVSLIHVARAGELHAILCDIPRKNPVWAAMRAFWAALTMYSADRRYPFFWMGLEALFGPDEAVETTYKLCQRIAFFIADSLDEARKHNRTAKTCYNTRSKIIHGRWKDDPTIDVVMADTEAFVRTGMCRLLENPELLRTFASRQRDQFLEDLVFSRFSDPPPWAARPE